MEKWEKKFDLTWDGRIVFAEYANERTYRLEFNSEEEAGTFVKEFQAAQLEIETRGKLKTIVKIAGNVSEHTIKFIFADKNSSLAMKCKFETENDILTFHNRMRAQITRYSS